MTTVLHRSSKKAHLDHDFTAKNKAIKGRDDVTPELKELAVAVTRRIATILHEHAPVNMGQGRTGSLAQGKTLADLLEGMKNLGGLSACVFDNHEALEGAVDQIRREDLGQSVTLGGDLEQIFSLCTRLNLTPHTAIVSLGCYGNLDLLPANENLRALTMMCGHGLLGACHCQTLVDAVRTGSLSPDAAARKLAAGCGCGAVNTSLAASILADLAD